MPCLPQCPGSSQNLPGRLASSPLEPGPPLTARDPELTDQDAGILVVGRGGTAVLGPSLGSKQEIHRTLKARCRQGNVPRQQV